MSYIQLFGVAVIFLLIASHNFANLLDKIALHFCDWSIIITLVMVPIAMFGTPKDFWPIAIGAMLFTGFACVLILTETLREVQSPLPDHKPITFE